MSEVKQELRQVSKQEIKILMSALFSSDEASRRVHRRNGRRIVLLLALVAIMLKLYLG